jgi:hypothetical protein
MPDKIITVRLHQRHAAYLHAKLALLAMATRQAVTRPWLTEEQRTALRCQELLLESLEDAVRDALLEVPQSARESARCAELVRWLCGTPCEWLDSAGGVARYMGL